MTRELAEECGLAAESVRELARVLSGPSLLTEYVHVFEATHLHVVGPLVLGDDKDVEVEGLPISSALERLADAVSIAALAVWVGKPSGRDAGGS